MHLIRCAQHFGNDLAGVAQGTVNRNEQRVAVLGDLTQQIPHREQLERQTARIALIGQDQVQRRRGLHDREVTGAISDHGIPQFQGKMQPRLDAAGLHRARRLIQQLLQLLENGMGTLHPPAEVEEQPPAATHHVLRGETRDGGGKL